MINSVSRAIGIALWCLSLAAGQTPAAFSEGLRAAREGDWQAAEREFRKCRQQDPGSVECNVHHADALARLGQPYDGILELESFISGHPSAVPAVELYAELLQKVAQDYAGAERALEKATESVSDDPQLWRILGALYAAQRKAAEAIRCYERAIKLRPDDPLVLSGLAYSHGLNGQEDQAAKEFGRALQLNDKLHPPGADVLVLYGGFLRNSGRAADSIPQLTRALQLNPHLWRVYYERALSYELCGDIARAETDAVRALQGAGDRRDIRLLLVRIYRASGKAAKIAEQLAAIQKLEDEENRYLATARDLRQALRAAEAAVDKGDCAGAVPQYEQVVHLMPSFYEAWFPLGVCYSQTGERAKAEQALTTYLKYQPLSADGHSALGLLYASIEKPREARRELRQALDIDPTDREAAAGLARIEFQIRDYTEALRWAELALSGDSRAAADIYGLAADASAATGDRRRALDYCTRGLRVWPDDAALQQTHAAILTSCLYAVSCRSELAQAVQQHPSSSVYRKSAARALVVVNPWDPETERMVRELTTQFPGDAFAWVIEGEWNERRNKLPQAIESANQALALAPASSAARVAALSIIARSTDARGDVTNARTPFEQAWDLNRRLGLADPASALSWAEFLERNGEHEACAAVLDEILRLSPSLAPARLARARHLAKRGESKRAIEDALLALHETDDPAVLEEAHALLARVYTALGQPAEAHQHEEWIASHH